MNTDIHFQLHHRLDQDTFFVQDLTLSRLLLMNDKRFGAAQSSPLPIQVKKLSN